MASPFLMSSPRSSFFLSSVEVDEEAGEAAAERGGECEFEWGWAFGEEVEAAEVVEVEAPSLRAPLEEQRRGAASSARRR